MSGSITREQRIKYLEEKLAETTNEKRRKEIEWEIEGLKLKLLHPPVQPCCPPPSRPKITGGKTKPEKEVGREGIIKEANYEEMLRELARGRLKGAVLSEGIGKPGLWEGVMLVANDAIRRQPQKATREDKEREA